MADAIQAVEESSAQPEPQPDSRPGQSEDPWKKSSVLTLDGGGIRGYASLWMLKILMDTIARLEKSDPEPHDSSFWPKMIPPRPNGATVQNRDQPINRTDTLATSESSSEPRLNFLRRLTNGTSPESQAVQDSIKVEFGNTEGYLPCHYFDYIAGTSTGGLNAIMLGRLRMHVEDCIERYPKLAQSVFGKKRSFFNWNRLSTTSKYDSGELETSIREIVQIRAPPGAAPHQEGFAFDDYHSPYDLCKTVVVANEVSKTKLHTYRENSYLFRTYPHISRTPNGVVKNPGNAHKHEIWKVARATSAAPTFFDPIQIDGMNYSDGGVGNNNPVQLMLNEVTSKMGTDYTVEAFSVLISLGTGQKPTRRLKVKHRLPRLTSIQPVKNIFDIIDKLKDSSTDSDKAHEWVENMMKQLKFQHYYRWTGGEQVGGLAMDEWHERRKADKMPTAKYIEEHVKKFMAQPEIKAEVENAARELVARRRARVASCTDNGKWKRYAYCILLRCAYCDDCLETADIAKQHIQTVHSDITHDEETLNKLVSNLLVRPPRCLGGPL